MFITAIAGALILASTQPKPASPPPPPPPSSSPHIKTFDGGGFDADLAKPAPRPAPSGGLAPKPKPAAPILLPAIQTSRDPVAPRR